MALANLPQPNNITNMIGAGKDLLDMFKGSSTTTSGGTETKQTILSPEAVNALVQQILGGSSGLASVASGERAAGMYNSTVNTQLLNDLMSRTAGEVAVRGAPTVVSSTPKTVTKNPQASLGQALLMTAGGTLANNLLKSGAKDAAAGVVKSSIPELDVNKLSDYMSDSSIADTGSYSTVQDISEADLANYGVSGADGTDFSLSGDIPFLSIAGNIAEGDIGGLSLDALTAAMPEFGLPIKIADLLTGGSVSQGATDVASFAGSAVQGVGEGLDAVGELGGDILDALGCFITTVVCHQLGKADDCYELETLRAFRDSWLQENHPDAIEVYYATAPAIAKKLSELPDAPLVLNGLYKDFILPCVDAVQSKQYDLAYEIYQELYERAKELTFTE